MVTGDGLNRILKLLVSEVNKNSCYFETDSCKIRGMNINPMEAAVTAAAGQSKLARALGVSHTAVCKWRKSGHPPATRVIAIERITGVSRHLLRPDVYGPAPVEDHAA